MKVLNILQVTSAMTRFGVVDVKPFSKGKVLIAPSNRKWYDVQMCALITYAHKLSVKLIS